MLQARKEGFVPYILMLKGMNAQGEANPTQDGKPLLTSDLPSNNFNSYFQLRLFLKMAVNYVSTPFQSHSLPLKINMKHCITLSTHLC